MQKIINRKSGRHYHDTETADEEVKYGFLYSLLPAYAPEAAANSGTDIYTLDDYIEDGNLDGVKRILTALFANIPYTSDKKPFEHYFQCVIYLVFTLLGKLTVFCKPFRYLYYAINKADEM